MREFAKAAALRQIIAWREEWQKAVRFPVWQFSDRKVLGGKRPIDCLQDASRSRGSGVSRQPPGVRQSPGALGFCLHLIDNRLEIIVDAQSVGFEIVNRFHNCRRGHPLEPSRRTPLVLVGYRHQAVANWILMHVAQACQIRSLMSQPGLPKVVPHLPVRGLIQPVYPASRLNVEDAQHIGEDARIGRRFRGMAYEMIVIRKHRPRLQSPAKVLGHFEQPSVKYSQAPNLTEMMLLQIGSDGHEISATRAELVRRSMRPRDSDFWHRREISKCKDTREVRKVS